MTTKQLLIILTLTAAVFMTSCQYEFVVEPELPPIDPTVEIKFATEIAPLFESNQCLACHKTGGKAPDLSADKAYASIVPALINTAEPETSKIYWYPHPDASTHNFKKYKKADAELILAWIKQGAKNN